MITGSCNHKSVSREGGKAVRKFDRQGEAPGIRTIGFGLPASGFRNQERRARGSRLVDGSGDEGVGKKEVSEWR
jgi:hypothetical protein